MQNIYERSKINAGRNISFSNLSTSNVGKSLAPKPDAGSLNMALTFSEQSMNALKNKEGLRLKPYDDQTGKPITEWVKGATIGYGKLISEQEWPQYKDGISEQDAEQLLKLKLVQYEAAVKQAIHVPLNQSQYDALVIFAYNIGINAFSNSSTVKLINDPTTKTPYSSLEQAWEAFNKSQGKINEGLKNRRDAEWKMYNSSSAG